MGGQLAARCPEGLVRQRSEAQDRLRWLLHDIDPDLSWIVLAAVFLATGGKPYYLGGLLPVLLAAGATPVDRWLKRGRRGARPRVTVEAAEEWIEAAKEGASCVPARATAPRGCAHEQALRGKALLERGHCASALAAIILISASASLGHHGTPCRNGDDDRH